MLPTFSNLKTDNIVDTLNAYIHQNQKTLSILLQVDKPDWNNFFAPIERLDNELNNFWSIVSHLNSVQNSNSLRQAYNACLPALSQYITEMRQNKTLYRKFLAMRESKKFIKLNTAQQKSIENSLRDFSLAGIDLPEDQQKRYKAINLRLSELSSKFSENVLDATNSWHKYLSDDKVLSGLPESALASAKTKAAEQGQTGYMLGLDFPSYLAVMQYADNRDLRFDLYQAYQTRASGIGVHDASFDNSDIMQEILSLKSEKATLLKFNSYAQLSIQTKMATQTNEVFEFLNNLLDKSMPQARAEFNALQNFAKEIGLDKLEPWDVAYTSEKMRQAMFTINSEALRPWFPLDKVLSGMFAITKKLFAVDFKPVKKTDVWHSDVQVFELIENRTTKAYFYIDLYARSDKQGGAWMDVCREQIMLANGQMQIPIAYLTCNFKPPIDNKPALLTHEELTTLFHEFGHSIHHMLSQISIPSVGGINGVPWDAVELPSQFMENFCWSEGVMPLISGHFKTDEPLPKDKLNALLASKNFQSAMAMIRQLELALFDFTLHDNFKDDYQYIEQTLAHIRTKTALMPTPKWNRTANSFSHIFAGGYAAGYYSYKWAEVLSADAFSLFEQNGVLDSDTGNQFKSNILQKGGSVDIMDLFIRFRGRSPNIDALLRHSGIDN